MPKSIALFDIDNTVYDGFSYFDLLAKQAVEGLISTQVVVDAKASMQKYKSKQQDYESTIVELLDIYAAGLKGVRYQAVLNSTKDFYRNSPKFFTFFEPVTTYLHPTHDLTIVTGEPQFVAEAVGELYGIESFYSTQYKTHEEVFTGEIIRYLASRHEKHDAIKQLMEDHGSLKSFAFGDSEGDVEMLRAVQFPICINPNDGLRAIAKDEGWATPDISEVPQLIAKLSTS